jgi:hypothetical protein
MSANVSRVMINEFDPELVHFQEPKPIDAGGFMCYTTYKGARPWLQLNETYVPFGVKDQKLDEKYPSNTHRYFVDLSLGQEASDPVQHEKLKRLDEIGLAFAIANADKFFASGKESIDAEDLADPARREKAVRKKYQPLYKVAVDAKTKQPKGYPPNVRAKLQKKLPPLKGKDGKKRRATEDEVDQAAFDLKLYSLEGVERTEPVDEVLGSGAKAISMCELSGMWVTAGMCGLQLVLRQAAVATAGGRPEGCALQLPNAPAASSVPTAASASASVKAKVAPVSVANGEDTDSEGEGEGEVEEGGESEGGEASGGEESEQEEEQPALNLKPAPKATPVVPPPAPPAAPKAVKGEDVAPKKVAKKVVKKTTAVA